MRNGGAVNRQRSAKYIALTFLLVITSWAVGESYHFILNETQLAAVETKYGQPARKRMVAWMDLMANNKPKSDQEKLTLVNDFFNQILWVADLQLWGVPDYWETPLEMLGKGAGDCEDFAISKYFTLLALGVSVDKLKITYVKARNAGPENAAHMVLTYYASPAAMPVVLDNLIGEIKPADQRPDLTPVYSFNGEGLWLAKERGLGKSVDGGNKQGNWRGMLARMGKEI
jgi:predicted transglutaminase-like cysteine proteinase